ncbi:MAG: hypothetical protein DCC75_06360 [Proteobacteria bacterium]|nr:MAG: hypothetical protein DCC75_06360 [Pseudomonadota bacterium]
MTRFLRCFLAVVCGLWMCCNFASAQTTSCVGFERTLYRSENDVRAAERRLDSTIRVLERSQDRIPSINQSYDFQRFNLEARKQDLTSQVGIKIAVCLFGDDRACTFNGILLRQIARVDSLLTAVERRRQSALSAQNSRISRDQQRVVAAQAFLDQRIQRRDAALSDLQNCVNSLE